MKKAAANIRISALDREELETAIECVVKSWSDFWEFLKICRTYKGEGKPVLEHFPDWPHFHTIVESLNKRERKKIVKARQIMVTWLLCAWMLWVALTVPGSEQLIISRREREAAKALKRIKFLFFNFDMEYFNIFWYLERDSDEMLKFDLRPEFKPLIEKHMDIVWNPTEIMSLPSTKEEGRSYNPTHTLIDEAAFIENLESILEGLDASCEHITVVSSPNEVPSYFDKFWAMDNDFKKMKFTWRVRPDHDENWKAQKIRSLKSVTKFEREHECKFPEQSDLSFKHFDISRHTFKEWPNNIIAIFGGIDFGWDDPFVTQWWGYDGFIYWCLFEYRKEREFLSKHAQKIKNVEHELKKRYNISGDIIYYAGTAEAQERNEMTSYGVQTFHYHTFVLKSIQEVDALFEDNRIKINVDCIWLLTELETYVFGVSREDHSVDAMRYALGGYLKTSGNVQVASIKPKIAVGGVTQSRRRRRRERLRLENLLRG